MCAAPKGNKFYLLISNVGRKRLFESPKAMWKAACEYFEWCDNNPLQEAEIIRNPDNKPQKAGKTPKKGKNYEIVNKPHMRPYTLQGLCRYLHCNTVYFSDFRRGLIGKTDKTSKAFAVVVDDIYETIYQQKFEGASSGFFNSNIIARDLGLTDRKQSEVAVTGANVQFYIPENGRD